MSGSPPRGVVAFDVYGTLVDPLAMAAPLAAVVGERDAAEAAALWRRTQVEYAFRRGLMGAAWYVDFDRCTAQALRLTLGAYRVAASEAVQADLLAAYRSLPPFPDAAPGLARLRSAGHTLLAFSNGPEASIRALLGGAGLLPLLDGVVSVDDLRTYKPNPAVYGHLVRRGGRPMAETWLITANAWDAIGAKASGLRVAWLRRSATARFDPWEAELTPDHTVERLDDLADLVGLAVPPPTADT